MVGAAVCVEIGTGVAALPAVAAAELGPVVEPDDGDGAGEQPAIASASRTSGALVDLVTPRSCERSV
jgi:hypothetical protein